MDRTGIRPAIAAGAHYLVFHVKVAGEKEDLLDSGVVAAWNVSASIFKISALVLTNSGKDLKHATHSH